MNKTSKTKRIFAYVLLIFMAIALTVPTITGLAATKVYHVPIHSNVEKGLYAFLERSIEEAKESGADVLLLDIHTPGGAVDAAEDIGKLLLGTKDLKIIAFINTKAHSAGAYIALHADEIYMRPTATIGAAGVITSDGNAASEKATSAWIAQMITAAESKGRDPIYAEAMANPNVELPDETLRKQNDTYITLTATEAEKVGYSNGNADSLEEVYALAGIQDPETVDMEPTLAENIARLITNPIVVPVLLSIATMGLVIELYSPGFGIPGTMSLAAFGLFFYGHLIAGFAGYESIILFVIGLILFIIEFFVPGGIMGIIGAALIIISLLLAGASVTHMAFSIIIAMFVAVLGMVILMKFFGKKIHVFNKLILRDATTTDEGYVSNENRIDLVHQKGITVTPMRPAGVIVINGERIDAVSEGGFIDKGKEIEVIKVEGSRIVVRDI